MTVEAVEAAFAISPHCRLEAMGKDRQATTIARRKAEAAGRRRTGRRYDGGRSGNERHGAVAHWVCSAAPHQRLCRVGRNGGSSGRRDGHGRMAVVAPARWAHYGLPDSTCEDQYQAYLLPAAG